MPPTQAGSRCAGSSGASVDPIQIATATSYSAVCRKANDARYLPLGERESAGADRGQHTVVAERVDHDRDAGMVLRGGAHHRRPADVDLLDALVLDAPEATVSLNG